MLINKDSFTIDRRIGTAETQLLSEGEFNLEEGKADIADILRCDADFAVTDSKVTSGRVSFSGRLNLKGMYTSEILGENKSVAIHSFDYELPVSDFVNIEGAEEGMNTYINCNVVKTDCRIVNAGKLAYKVLTDVSVTVRENAVCEYVSGVEDIPSEQQRLAVYTPEAMPVSKRDSFTVRDSITLPMGKPNIEELLSCDIGIASPEYKAGENSVRVSGDISVSMLYKGEGETNPMELYEFDVPFSGELEADGLTADMLCEVNLSLTDSNIRIAEDEDGEMRIAELEAVIGADITARSGEEISVLEDIYVPNKAARLTTESVAGCVCVARNCGQCPVKEVVMPSDKAPDMLQIYKADGRAYIDFTEVSENKVDIEGAVAVNILYVTGNDELPVYCFTSMIPFKHTAQTIGSRDGMTAETNARLEHIGFNMLSDREVEVRCVINICTTVENEQHYELVSDVCFDELDKDYLGSLSGITLYVVRKGDTLWKLAKRFNTTIEDIVAVNDIENPDLIYPGQRLIIVKKYSL